MKRVACLSTIVPSAADITNSSQVIDVFNLTRILNENHGFTGAFIVYRNYVLIVADGNSESLGNLIFKFRQDYRVSDCSVIFNREITSPAFSSWGIKVFKGSKQDHKELSARLKACLKDGLRCESPLDLERINCFFSLSGASSSKVSTSTNDTLGAKSSKVEEKTLKADNKKYSTKSLFMSGWPKPGQIQLSPNLIRLCARLVGRSIAYDEILALNFFSSESELIERLAELDALGLLKQRDKPGGATISKISDAPKTKAKSTHSDRFGMVLKNFLTATRS
ncbi:BLUF domain-containing protein [Aurantivibrio plasticivorans]